MLALAVVEKEEGSGDLTFSAKNGDDDERDSTHHSYRKIGAYTGIVPSPPPPPPPPHLFHGSPSQPPPPPSPTLSGTTSSAKGWNFVTQTPPSLEMHEMSEISLNEKTPLADEHAVPEVHVLETAEAPQVVVAEPVHKAKAAVAAVSAASAVTV
mmetsp:Transcript_11528/g.35250  ORF Transcript_11528/g.35250 Transcript_11528/m.35250 type:complete len:154 (+) Transcript_11528:439-900(+)